jgi:hypothetical protein
MPSASSILSLSERLRKSSRTARRAGHDASAFDLRAASIYLRHLASLLIASEAEAEPNIKRKVALEREAAALCDGGSSS